MRSRLIARITLIFPTKIQSFPENDASIDSLGCILTDNALPRRASQTNWRIAHFLGAQDPERKKRATVQNLLGANRRAD
jgi:hypothetical protein